MDDGRAEDSSVASDIGPDFEGAILWRPRCGQTGTGPPSAIAVAERRVCHPSPSPVLILKGASAFVRRSCAAPRSIGVVGLWDCLG